MLAFVSIGAPLHEGRPSDAASTIQSLAQLNSKGLLTDALLSNAMKGLIEDAQVDPLSSGSKPAAPLGGADFERYGVNGIPYGTPRSPAYTAAQAMAIEEEEILERADTPAVKKMVIENKYQDNTAENEVSPDFINLDYMSQGYNLFFGNPLPTSAGIDPGFTDHAGQNIWDFQYTEGRTTGHNDGAYNLPDGLYVMHDNGCKLSMSASTTSSTKAYQSELSASVSLSGGFDAAFASGSFSASADYQKNEQTNSEASTETIISKSECVVYHAILPTFEPRPKFTKGFQKAVHMAMKQPTAHGKQKVLWQLFDSFGTHFPTLLRMGSRFGMYTTISTEESSKYGSTSMSASIAVALNKKIQKTQKCDEDCGGEEEDEGKDKEDDKKDEKKDDDKKKEKVKGLERLKVKGLERLTSRPPVFSAAANWRLAGGPFASLLEVQAGRGHRKHAAARRRHGGSVAADLEAVKEAEVAHPKVSAARLVSHAPQPVRGVPAGDVRGFLIQTLRREREKKMDAAGELERELGGSFSASVSGSMSSSTAESFAKSSSDMQMISMGAPPMGDVEEWAQQSFDFPMPLSSELSNICLLVASVASGKQVAGFGFVATGNASKLTNGVPRSDKLSAGLVAPSLDPEPSISSEQQKAIGDDGTPEVVINFHATEDDPSGTVAACQEAFKMYCVNHLKLGAACSGPRARAVPAAYSKCTKDSDCKAYATGAKGFTLTCNDDNHCVPSYNNLREIRFMASGDTGAAPQTCETLVQGAGAKYTEIGDFQKKNFGQPKTNTINYMTPSNTGMFVNAKLCGIQSDSPPDPPICDILLGSGPSAAGVEKAMKGKGIDPFGFKEIPASFAGDGGTGAIEQSFNADGMFLSQLGMGGYWEGFSAEGFSGAVSNDNCKYVKLYTTSIGCNLPQMPAGKEMTCLKFVKTKLHNTPYGPIDDNVQVTCTDTVKAEYSGWCECQLADGSASVIHAPKSQERNPIGKEYTCEEECKKPTWIPAVSALEMTYTTADIAGLSIPGQPPADCLIKPGAAADDLRQAAGVAYVYVQGGGAGSPIKKGQGAKCSTGYYEIEHLYLDNSPSIGATCISLNGAFMTSSGVIGPPASKLCYKR